MKQIKKNYKAFTGFYWLLFLLSVVIIAVSFIIPKDSRWFTIIAGFGCSGVAFVIVAWLIERANCAHKEKANIELLDRIFDRFDLETKQALNLLLEALAKRDDSIDLDRE